MSGENKRIDGDYDSSLSNTQSTRKHRCLSGAMWSWTCLPCRQMSTPHPMQPCWDGFSFCQ